jgi:hypothetical protein
MGFEAVQGNFSDRDRGNSKIAGIPARWDGASADKQ